MKTLYHYFLILVAVAVIFASCSKEGPVGPSGATGTTGSTGATGPAGPVGPAGPTGANGQNGSIIYSGTTAPSSSTGITGDFYLDVSTGLLYGPKTASGWGTGYSLVGPAGAAGAAGSQIYSGSGVPANSLGAPGDYYLDKTTYMLYGPKVGSAWDVPISLQGPQGPPGSTGITIDTLTIPANQWEYRGYYPLEIGAGPTNLLSNRQLTYEYLDDHLTEAVLDNGIIMVYINTVPDYDDDVWVPMPLAYPVNNQYNFNFVFESQPGDMGFGIFFTKIDPNFTLPNIATYQVAVNYRFKILAIPPQAAGLLAANHVSINNYRSVSRVLGLWKQDKPTVNHAKL